MYGHERHTEAAGSNIKHQASRILTRCLQIYTLFLAFWFALSLILGDAFWWLAALNYVAPYLFAPTLLVVLLVITMPARAHLPLVLVPLLLFGMLFWPYWLPRPARTPRAATVRVMTFNVLYSNDQPGQLAAVIRAQQPDLVALQEVQPALFGALTRELRADYPYHVLAPANPYGTTAVLSRVPLQRTEIIDLGADRPAVLVQATVRNEPVTFVAAHLIAWGLGGVPWYAVPRLIEQRTAARRTQVERLISATKRFSQGPVIIGCDCNMHEVSDTHHLLASRFASAAQTFGWRLSTELPPGAALDTNPQHLDYLFYRGALVPQRVYKPLDSGGSDHQPLVAEFTNSSHFP